VSSSKPFKHTITEVAPDVASIGDEYYKPSTNELFKRIGVDGKTVQWVKMGGAAMVGSGDPILRQRGSVLQVATFQTGAVATGTGTIPLDDTIPQITEGTEFMTLAITPTSATNKLIINVTIQLDKNNVNSLTVAMFQDSTVNAIAAQFYGALASGLSLPMSYTFSMTAGTTSSTTFRVRAGSEAAGTVTMNGRGGGRIDGGVAVSSITIYEVAG